MKNHMSDYTTAVTKKKMSQQNTVGQSLMARLSVSQSWSTEV